MVVPPGRQAELLGVRRCTGISPVSASVSSRYKRTNPKTRFKRVTTVAPWGILSSGGYRLNPHCVPLFGLTNTYLHENLSDHDSKICFGDRLGRYDGITVYQGI